MKFLAALACLALSACAFVSYDPSRQPPRGDERVVGSRSERDVIVSVPDDHNQRAERANAADRCREYGRVAERQGDDTFACVRPGEASHDRRY
jgi:hypothetical protein